MTLLEAGRDVFTVARRAQVPVLAAGLAYFGFTSLLPLSLLAVAGFSLVADEAAVAGLVEVTTSVLGEDLGDRVADAILDEETRLSGSVVGAAVFLWSAGRLFGGTERAFAAVYGETTSKPLSQSVRDAVVVFATNLLAVVGLGAFVLLFGVAGGVAARLAPLGLFVALVVVFLPMYYVFPMADVTLTEVLPGTVLAAGAWAIASVFLGVYAGTTGARSYGAAATAILVLTWLYVGGYALLLGATLNAVLADRVDPETVSPHPDAMGFGSTETE